MKLAEANCHGETVAGIFREQCEGGNVPEPATVRARQSDLAEACVSGEGGGAFFGWEFGS